MTTQKGGFYFLSCAKIDILELYMSMNESFPPASSKEVPSLDSQSKYEKVAENIGHIAEEISEVPVPEETIEDWRTLMRLLYKTDHALDSIASPDEKNEKIKVFKDALHGTPKGKDVFVEETLEEIDTLTKNFSEEEKRFFLRLLSMLLTTTEEVSKSMDAHTAAKYTLLEGQITSRLFLPFLSREFRESDQYEKFVSLIATLGRIGNGLDTLVDLPTDYQNGQIQTKPTLYNRAIFLGTVLTQTKSLLQDRALSKDLLKRLFLKTARAVVEDR